jgi:hypothetical protein
MAGKAKYKYFMFEIEKNSITEIGGIYGKTYMRLPIEDYDKLNNNIEIFKNTEELEINVSCSRDENAGYVYFPEASEFASLITIEEFTATEFKKINKEYDNRNTAEHIITDIILNYSFDNSDETIDADE